MRASKPTTAARRQFIKNAAILAPAITLFPSWLTASTGSRLRIAFIGAGAWAQQYLQTTLQHRGVEVKAICEHDAMAIQQTKQIFKQAGIALPVLYNEGATAYTKLLACTDVDAVIIATPWHTHYEIAKAALLAGKHVACGAIMGSTVEEHWDIVHTSKQTGKQYITLDEQSYRRDLMAVSNLVHEGKLGALQSIHAGAAYAALGHATMGNMPYPVYPAAATAGLLGINHTNQYLSLCVQQRQQDYVVGKTHPKTGAPYFCVNSGLVNTIHLNTSNNQSVVLQSNFNTKENISTGFRILATGGSWMDIWKQVQITGADAVRLDLHNNNPHWNTGLAHYKQTPVHENAAMALHEFVSAVQQPAKENLPVYAAATNSMIGVLANLSQQQGGTSIPFPNFYS